MKTTSPVPLVDAELLWLLLQDDDSAVVNASLGF